VEIQTSVFFFKWEPPCFTLNYVAYNFFENFDIKIKIQTKYSSFELFYFVYYKKNRSMIMAINGFGRYGGYIIVIYINLSIFTLYKNGLSIIIILVQLYYNIDFILLCIHIINDCYPEFKYLNNWKTTRRNFELDRYIKVLKINWSIKI